MVTGIATVCVPGAFWSDTFRHVPGKPLPGISTLTDCTVLTPVLLNVRTPSTESPACMVAVVCPSSVRNVCVVAANAGVAAASIAIPARTDTNFTLFIFFPVK